MTDNMNLWNAVCKTDPAHTKKVAQRGGFTSIDAMYQVKRATEEFGPVGKGWGYHCVYDVLNSGGQVLQFCDLKLWWKEGEVVYGYGPVRGCNALISDKGRLDDDAAKKAMTDALTKALSHLGFSADVFLGLFDDNKYVQAREAEQQKDNKKERDSAWAVQIGARMAEAESVEQLKDMWEKLQPHLEGRSQEAVTFIEKAYSNISKQLGVK